MPRKEVNNSVVRYADVGAVSGNEQSLRQRHPAGRSRGCSTQFLGFVQLAGRRYVLAEEIQEVVQLFQICIAEARKNRGFVDLGEFIQFIQNRLRCRS